MRRVVIISPFAMSKASAEPTAMVYASGQVLAEKPVIMVAPVLELLFAGATEQSEALVSEWSGVTTKVFVLENCIELPAGVSQFAYYSPDDEKGERDARLMFPESFVE